MNSSGRIIGGVLIAIATAWILGIAGVFPFNNRTTNQIANNADRAPVTDPNAQRSPVSASQYTTQPGNQTPDQTISQNPNSQNPSEQGTSTAPLNSGTSGESGSASNSPSFRAAW